MQTEGEIGDHLNVICELAAQSCHADVACIVHCTTRQISEVLGAVGTNARRLAGNCNINQLDALSRPMIRFESLKKEKWFSDHPLATVFPDARRMHVVSIPTDAPEQTFLVVLDVGGARRKLEVTYLQKLAVLAGAILERRIAKLDRSVVAREEFAEAPPTSKSEVGEDAILSFLARTLPKAPALKGKGGFAYVVVRRWRAQLKDVQLAAIKGLKISPRAETVEFAASEIAQAVDQLFSGSNFSCVVPVPSGSSGTSNGLSVRIAEQVASSMGLPFNNCLDGEIDAGSSHPKRNVKLKPYRVTRPVSGQVLLVDDIATTGTHLALARDAIMSTGASVFAVAWIGG